MNSKKLKRHSKTIKYNSIWIAISTALLIAFADNQALIQSYVPGWAYLLVIMFNSAMGVYLRTITTEPLQ